MPSLFRYNRRAMVSVHDSDHGGAPDAGKGARWVREVLAAHHLDCPGKLQLLAQPKILGHVFNPVSFWLCHDAAGHMAPQDTLHARKIMHVSPFQPIEGGYAFRFDVTDRRIGIFIDYTSQRGGLIATLTGKRQPLSNSAIMTCLLRRPFGSRRVLGLIHWQALKLWWKGATFRSRPEPPESQVSR